MHHCCKHLSKGPDAYGCRVSLFFPIQLGDRVLVPSGPGQVATGVSPWTKDTGNTQAPEGRRRFVARNRIASRCMCVPSNDLFHPPPLTGLVDFLLLFPTGLRPWLRAIAPPGLAAGTDRRRRRRCLQQWAMQT